MEILVEAGRTDLVPGNHKGKTADEIDVGKTLGAAKNKIWTALRRHEHLYLGQIGIIVNSVEIPPPDENMTSNTEHSQIQTNRHVTLFYFLLNPEVLKEMYKQGKLPKSKFYKPY